MRHFIVTSIILIFLVSAIALPMWLNRVDHPSETPLESAESTNPQASGQIIAVSNPATTEPVFTGAVQASGDVRVTLLSVKRSTVFGPHESRNWRDPQGQTHTPGIEIVYMVEHLSDKSWDSFHLADPTYWRSGKRLNTHQDYIAGGRNVLSEYNQVKAIALLPLPSVDNPDEAHIVTAFERGIILDGDHFDIELDIGYGKSETFIFKNVPIE